MATTNTVVANYTGKVAQDYLLKALKAGDTLAQDLVTVRPGLKEKGINLRRIDVDNLFQDDSCTFSPTGDVDLDFRTLTAKKLKVNLLICKSDFEGSWEAEDMGDSAFDNMPQAYVNALMIHIAGKAAEFNDKTMWNGTDTAGSYEGFFTKLGADSDLPAAQNIASTTITAANVFAEMQKVQDVIPDEVYSFSGDLVWLIAPNVARAWMSALSGYGAEGQGGAGYMNAGFIGEKELNFNGVPMYMVRGLEANQMIAYKKDNLNFGTGLLADWTNVKVLDMSDVLGDDTLRFIMKLYAGVQYGFAEEVVVYGAPES